MQSESSGTIRAEGENRPTRPGNVIVDETGCFMGGQGSGARSIAYSEDTAPTIKAGDGGNRTPTVMYPEPIAFNWQEDRNFKASEETSNPIRVQQTEAVVDDSVSMVVRRLMPVEVERLFGFPDGYTLVTHKGKPASDSARYKVLGNSMGVNVVRWIGRRIELAEDMMNGGVK